MKVFRTDLPGVLLVEPEVFRDERGFFLETFRLERYAAAGVPAEYAQDCVSRSEAGVLRGIHLQWPNAQGKLVWVLAGEVLDVAVDLRVGSPAFGRSVTHTLSAEDMRQCYIPPGFGHGFLVTKGPALFAYKCSAPYDPASEITVRWNDPQLAIAWGVDAPILSAKDARAPLLADLPQDRLPRYAP